MVTTARATNPFRPWRLTVADYLRMIEAGILTDGVVVGQVAVDEVFP